VLPAVLTAGQLCCEVLVAPSRASLKQGVVDSRILGGESKSHFEAVRVETLGSWVGTDMLYQWLERRLQLAGRWFVFLAVGASSGRGREGVG
jgi:hypothetical protein